LQAGNIRFTIECRFGAGRPGARSTGRRAPGGSALAKPLVLYYSLAMRSLVFVAGFVLSALAGCSKKAEPVQAAAPRERVYVADEDGGNVVVIDTASDAVVARIPVGKRPRGLRVSPDGTRLFVALSGLPKA